MVQSHESPTHPFSATGLCITGGAGIITDAEAAAHIKVGATVTVFSYSALGCPDFELRALGVCFRRSNIRPGSPCCT